MTSIFKQPLKLPKFGDKQWQNELSITGESHENIIDAVLQINAFINETLGVTIQPYKGTNNGLVSKNT